MAKTCKGKWIDSKIRIDGDVSFKEDGTFEIKTENGTGELTGTHTTPDNKTVDISDAKCASEKIKFTREGEKDGKKFKYTYTGDLDGDCEAGKPCEIKNGKVNRVEHKEGKQVRNDDGDWTAQRPVTRVAE